jgi:hypothetical protein
MKPEAEQILKVDRKGRVWTPPERREAILDEYEHSGMPASKFAGHIGVKYTTFVSWVQKRKKQRGGGEGGATRSNPPAALPWVEAVVESSVGAATKPLVMHLRDEVRLEVTDAGQVALVAELLHLLGLGAKRC